MQLQFNLTSGENFSHCLCLRCGNYQDGIKSLGLDVQHVWIGSLTLLSKLW